MTDLFPKFFEGNEYFIDEKVNFLKFENEYKVYDEFGRQIGAIKQKLSAWHKIRRMLINKAIQPFTLHITDIDGNMVAVIHRGWTFWMSKIEVRNAEGNMLGTIAQKFKLLKPRFVLSDSNNSNIAEINGDWKAWSFAITDNTGKSIGNIDKKWAGAMKEIFTSADKYNVTIAPEVVENQNKIVIVSAAITIDMVLKESKN